MLKDEFSDLEMQRLNKLEQIADELEEAVTTIQRIIEETKKEN